MLALSLCSLLPLMQPAAAPGPVEEVLALLPQEAAGLLFVPNLERASDDLEAALKAMDRAGLLFGGDPLDQLVSALGIPLQLDRQGAAMIAWVLPPAARDASSAGNDSATEGSDEPTQSDESSDGGHPGDPIIVAFIPSHDPQQFLNLNFQATETAGRFLRESGSTVYGHALRTHAALSFHPLEGVLRPTGEGGVADLVERWPSHSMDLLRSGDIALAGNARAVAGAFREMMALLRRTQIARALPEDPARDEGLLSRLLHDVASSSAGTVTAIDFDPLAVVIRTSAQLREVREVKDREKAPGGLSALPQAPYHMALSMNLMPLHRLASLRSSLPFLAPETDMDRWFSLVHAASFAAYESPTGLRGGLFNDAALILTTDRPEEVRDLIRARVQSVPAVEQGIERRVAWREDRPVEGVGNVDVFEVRLARVPDHQVYRQVFQRLLFGPVGVNGFVHRFDRGVIVTFSQRPDILRRVIAAMHGGQNLSDDQVITAMRQWLPDDPDVEWFIDLGSLLQMLRSAVEFYPMLPEIPPYERQGELPPIGFSASLHDTRIDSTTIVPSAVAGILFDQLMKIITSRRLEPTP